MTSSQPDLRARYAQDRFEVNQYGRRICMATCICNGANPDCDRCGGSGFTGDSSSSSLSAFSLELRAIVDRPGFRRKAKKNRTGQPNIGSSPKSAPPAAAGTKPNAPAQVVPSPRREMKVCHQCNAPLRKDRLQRHMAKSCRQVARNGRSQPKQSTIIAEYKSEEQKNQEWFENSLLPGGLCNRR